MPIRLFLTLLAFLTLTPAARGQATQPAEPERRVVIISVDGLRPDAMLRAKAPALRGLMEAGSFTCWAQTTALAITLPSHTSMLTGAAPPRHGVDWNGDLDAPRPDFPKVPTLFEVAKAAGLSTAMVAGKSKFAALVRRGTPEHADVPPAGAMYSDASVGERASALLKEHRPRVLFIHLAGVDTTGHGIGWGSPTQLEAIAQADAAIGRVLATLGELKLREATLVIVSADHGGAGTGHGPNDVRSLTIPWIAAGPGVAKNQDLTTLHPDRTVHTEDTFATACAFLGLPITPGVEGTPVREIEEKRVEPQMNTDKH